MFTLTKQLPFANPQADLLVAGPNEEFMKKIKDAFALDAHFIHYGAQVHRTYKRIVVFAVAGMPKDKQKEFINWIYYLKTRLEDPLTETTHFHVV